MAGVGGEVGEGRGRGARGAVAECYPGCWLLGAGCWGRPSEPWKCLVIHIQFQRSVGLLITRNQGWGVWRRGRPGSAELHGAIKACPEEAQAMSSGALPRSVPL